MRRLTVVTALSGLALMMFMPPAVAGNPTVTIASFSFTPASLIVTQGDTVNWSNSADVAHTATSDAGFFDSGVLSAGASASATFASAGSFPYHCQIHHSMHGSIQVPVILSAAGQVPAGTRITIMFASAQVSGRTYDVQRKLGSGPWVTIASGLTGTSKKVALKKKGHFAFRAEVSSGGTTSGWSPKATIRVTAA